MALIDDLIRDEGFEGMPYKDSRGFDTIGIGTKLPLTMEEARWLAQYRAQHFMDQLTHLMPWIHDLPAAWRDSINNMVYEMGVERFLGFHIMLAKLKLGDGVGARDAALDSLWAKEVPERAKRVAGVFAQ